MTIAIWALITAVIVLLYGIIVIIETIWWPPPELHHTLMRIGGVLLIAWGLYYFWLRFKKR